MKVDPKKLAKYSANGNVWVGVFRDTQDYKDTGDKIPDGYISTIVAIAYIHEYGLGVVKRPWLSLSVKKDRKFYDKTIMNLLRESGNSKTKRNVNLNKFGKVAAIKIKKHIESNDIGLQANSNIVAELKGGNSPLIETRHFIRHITHKVKNES